ncbi:MAG: hypothetical protein JEZ03_07150 [Bacteroidales bacterium]|nr:hypothetical protein [Bacteroidales bacterium]
METKDQNAPNEIEEQIKKLLERKRIENKVLHKILDGLNELNKKNSLKKE